MSLLEYIILFGSAMVGGLVAFQIKTLKKKNLQLALSFGGAYILGIVVLHLLPEVYSGANHIVGFWILGGFFLQLLLEQLSRGVEHGHIHAPHTAHRKIAFQIMLGLCIHSLIEGIPLSGYDSLHNEIHGHNHGGHHLLIGIILHKMPAAFAIAMLFKISGFSKRMILASLILFSIMSPLGAYIGSIIELTMDQLKWVIALVIGNFLHIATTIIFETDESSDHKIAWQKLLTIFSGTLLALLTLV